MSISLFSGTPTVIGHDNRGLTVRDIVYHRHPGSPEATDERITRHRYDGRGFLTQSVDSRLHERGLANFSSVTDAAGRVLRARGADNGTIVMLNDAAGRAFMTVSNILTTEDDTEDLSQAVTRNWQHEEGYLPGRPLSVTEQVTGGATRITARFVYAGDTEAEKKLNLAGQCVSHYDTAGLMQTSSFALTGAPLSVTRRLLKYADNPDVMTDWHGMDAPAWNDLLDSESQATLTIADATGAVLATTDARGNLQRVAYDVAGLLSGSWLTVKGGKEQVIVASLTYSAAGQKLREAHGNGVVTSYAYEVQTQRLTCIKTARPAGHASGAKVLQDLRYEYDPVGNVLSVRNDAEETRFWRNQKVVTENTYAYDSLYQLVRATGREMAGAGLQGSSLPPATVPLLTDNSAYTNYTRVYSYDTDDNLTQVRHSPATGSGYTTKITVSDKSNRGVLSTLTENAADVHALFTAGGQQRQLQPGQSLVWTPRNELLKVVPVVRDGGTDDGENYRYDGDSQRILKVSVQKTGAGTKTQRVLYLPGLELRTTASINRETESLQVITVGKAGRALVRVLHWTSGGPGEITDYQPRYSYVGMLGNCGLELDADGNIISMEEYYPYGGTAILTARSQTEVDYKTIRYSGKERDATGLYYYGYRYYLPWVGRWLSADPAGTVDGLNLFRMCRNNPVPMLDKDGCAPEYNPRKDFSKLEEKMKSESPEVQRKAILGMALTSYLLEFEIDAKLGGSLVARLYGAARAPKDIDIDIGNRDGSPISVSKYKSKIKGLENKYISLPDSLIKIESVAEKSGVLHIKHRMIVNETSLYIDPFEEEDQENVDIKLFSNSPVHEEIVDIGTYNIFEVAGLVLGSDPTPHVKPELLIAGFLSRMDVDKNDSEQSLALIRHLSSEGRSNTEIEERVLSHVNQNHSNFNKLSGRLKSVLSH
ncbi:RHS repeat protein [Pantoea agglomerans]|jgi:insecticidal toxin complex protein TccC|uniref:RHS repeat protein n=1 Tax=Enterobacter agglomerans TaxID=549 RepID=UPI0013BD3EBA|nr:RHS repeat domain-containing protein [Pantoea agglomerans]MDQ0431032.1 insecticidal toxin complex protein TccC [Pantoea agglomerans]NEG84759.1 RHS repeat protein [Pantoea agglomerans]NEH06900.1 RHS repeat protein [Pantoea agglomerans]